MRKFGVPCVEGFISFFQRTIMAFPVILFCSLLGWLELLVPFPLRPKRGFAF